MGEQTSGSDAVAAPQDSASASGAKTTGAAPRRSSDSLSGLMADTLDEIDERKLRAARHQQAQQRESHDVDADDMVKEAKSAETGDATNGSTAAKRSSERDGDQATPGASKHPQDGTTTTADGN